MGRRGLCSYLLIGFYFLKKFATDAGNKAFIVNRIGDFGFTLAMFLIVGTAGAGFRKVFTFQGAPVGKRHLRGHRDRSAAAGGACGKSAQIPLYVWLPDAMEGPTPGQRVDPRGHHGDGGRVHGGALGGDLHARADGHGGRRHDRPASRRSSRRPSAWRRTISRRCSPIPPSAVGLHVFGLRAWARFRRASST
jgi:hypothetical protein